jgi:hypothetical protein
MANAPTSAIPKREPDFVFSIIAQTGGVYTLFFLNAGLAQTTGDAILEKMPALIYGLVIPSALSRGRAQAALSVPARCKWKCSTMRRHRKSVGNATLVRLCGLKLHQLYPREVR